LYVCNLLALFINAMGELEGEEKEPAAGAADQYH